MGNINRINYEKEKILITREASKVMDLAIIKAFQDLDANLIFFMNKLYYARRSRAENSGRLRDALVALTLKICGVEKLNQDHYSVIAAGEFYNLASYYQNWHLDDKKNITTENDKKMCHIASHFFRDLSEKIINDTKFNDQIKIRLMKEISESNTAVQKGQSFELNELTINNLEKYQSDQKLFLRDYQKRCFLFSGKFYGCSFAMGPIMAGLKDEQINKFKYIGELFGTGGQMINDVGDFCLSKNISHNVEKDYQDQFADLIKGTLTLPVYELLKIIEINDIKINKIDNDKKSNLLTKMLSGQCFDSSRIETNKLRNELLKNIGLIPQGAYIKDLKMIVKTFFNCNKFYVNLRENHNYSWKI